MKYLMIKSKGEIDPKAFQLIGASSKRDNDDKIGYFGSGLKYAIASILRKNLEIKVFSGYREIKLQKIPIKFRNKNFDVITVNGKETSLTTDMGGKFWKNDFSAFREIYCNALDEGETDINIVDEENVKPIEDFTTFYIEATTDIKTLYLNIDKYFTSYRTDKIAENKYGRLYNCKFIDDTVENKINIYRKSIFAGTINNTQPLFDYDLEKIEVNESRTFNCSYSVRRQIVKLLKQIDNVNVIKTIIEELSTGNTSLEQNLYWDYGDFSKEWLKELTNYTFVNIETIGYYENYDLIHYTPVPSSFLKSIRNIDGVKVLEQNHNLNYPSKDLTSNEKAILEETIDHIKDLGFKIPKNVVIQTGIFNKDNDNMSFISNNSIRALTDIENRTILLSERFYNYDLAERSKVLIEEYVHIITGFADETRNLQNYLFSIYYESLRINKAKKDLDKELEEVKCKIIKLKKRNLIKRIFNK